MSLHFTKMHGLGNDFAVVDARTAPFHPDRALVRAMADRHTGIGFDQLLTIEPARDGVSTFYYGIWNADGEPVGQCGNGVRCVAAWLHRDGALAIGQNVRVESPSGPVDVRLADALTVAVDMGEPEFAPARIPFVADVQSDDFTLDVAGETLTLGAVSIGNPHAVVDAEGMDGRDIDRLGPVLSAHPRFPEGCNADFVVTHGRAAIDLRVHERGSGWTLACGTGACAAMAVLRRADRVDAHVAVTLPGGTLGVDWAGSGHRLTMTGPAAFVYEGAWPLKPAR